MIYPKFTFPSLLCNISKVIPAFPIQLVHLLLHILTLYIPYLGSSLRHFPTSKVLMFCITYSCKSSSFFSFKSLLKLHSLHYDPKSFLFLKQCVANTISLTHIWFVCGFIANLNLFHKP